MDSKNVGKQSPNKQDLLNSNTVLGAKLESLRNVCDSLLPKAAEFDFDGVQANGVRTFLYMVDKLLSHIPTQLEQDENFAKNMQITDDVVSIFCTMAELIVDATLDGHKLSPLEVSAKLTSPTQEQIVSLIQHTPVWLPEDQQNLAGVRGYFMALAHGKYLNLFSEQKRQKFMGWYAKEANLEDGKKFGGFLEAWPMVYLSTRNTPVDYCQTFNIACKSKQQLQVDGSIIEKETENVVEIQVIRHGRSEEYNGVVIYHAHGGGFIMAPPVVHQSYLRQWAQAMPGCTIISPNYRLAPEHKYPLGLQDILDVYLALIGKIESNREQVLPDMATIKKMVLYGDSAGGNLIPAMCLILQDIGIEIPNNMFLLYPCGSPNFFRLYPSLVFSMLEIGLAPASLFNMADAYTPGNVLDYTKDKTAWFRRDNYAERAKEMTDKTSTDRFFNPLLSDFSCFSNTRCLIVCGDFDLLIDTAVEYANKWPVKSNVQLVIAEGCQHSFVLGKVPSQQKACDKLVQELKVFCRI